MTPESIASELIKLSPALPCYSEKFGGAFVCAVSKSRLSIQLAKSNSNTSPRLVLNKPDKLTMYVDSDRTIDLNVLWDDLGETPSVQIQGPDVENKLSDFITVLRKNQHINLCQHHDVEAKAKFTGFDRVSFRPTALPAFNESTVHTKQTFLGRTFTSPLLITGMTGGVEKGTEINRLLARTAEFFDIPMGVGSQRIALDNAKYQSIFNVRRYAPRLFLIGNIGFSQLVQKSAASLCEQCVDMIEADALAIHLNVLQEMIQVEGSRNFTGILDTLAEIKQKIKVPLILKEVGSGIDPASAEKLIDIGVDAIDVGGSGGTSWSYIEGLRSNQNSTKRISEVFRDWGIPTAYAIQTLRKKYPDQPLVATGGIRDGLMVAKAIGLGATMTGVGLPLFRAALESEKAVHGVVDELIRGLKTTMVCTSSATLEDLKAKLDFTPYPYDPQSIPIKDPS